MTFLSYWGLCCYSLCVARATKKGTQEGHAVPVPQERYSWYCMSQASLPCVSVNKYRFTFYGSCDSWFPRARDTEPQHLLKHKYYKCTYSWTDVGRQAGPCPAQPSRITFICNEFMSTRPRVPLSFMPQFLTIVIYLGPGPPVSVRAQESQPPTIS